MLLRDLALIHGTGEPAVDPVSVRAQVRARLDLADDQQEHAWLATHGIDPITFAGMLGDEAMTQAVLTRRLPFAEQHLIDYLIVSGEYARLLGHGQKKDHCAALAKGYDLCTQTHTATQAVQWFLEYHGLDPQTDMAALGQVLGHSNKEKFLKAIVVDFLYHDMNDMRVDEPTVRNNGCTARTRLDSGP